MSKVTRAKLVKDNEKLSPCHLSDEEFPRIRSECSSIRERKAAAESPAAQPPFTSAFKERDLLSSQ
jgi:hypothetical protein